MQVRNLMKVGVALLLPVSLAACGGDRNRDTPAPDPTPPGATPTGTFQSKFGSSFEATFNAGNTTEPRNPSASDVPPLNNTADPLDN